MSRKPFIILFLLLLAGWLLFGVFQNSYTIRPLQPGAKILAFGDSLTYGKGASQGKSYPQQLGALLNRPVLSSGVSGEVSSKGLLRLENVLNDNQIDLLLLCHGGNDILQRRSEEQLKENLISMVEMAREYDFDVILISVPRYGVVFSDHPVYSEVSEQLKVPLLSDTVSRILRDNTLKSDKIHPNDEGYLCLAEDMADFIEARQSEQ
ncbi:MAG: arylesterase [Planctomycetes bacterium]|nr:arylesterase [Planctomycetota bacterium]